MGRRKIEIQPLTDDRNRTVTFVKRKAGLFKKAYELAVLCQVDLSVIIVGNNNKIYEFSTVDSEEIFKTYDQVIDSNKRIHESKSPEHYSNYKKKSKLNEPLTDKSGQVVASKANLDDSYREGDDNEDEYEEDDDDDGDGDGDADQNRNRDRDRGRERDKHGDRDGDGDHDNASEVASTRRKTNHKRDRSHSQNRNPKVFNSKKPAPSPPPSHISLNNVPTFNKYKKTKLEISETHTSTPSPVPSRKEGSSRPILRVQIPSDPKGSNSNGNKLQYEPDKHGSQDTAMTITAVDQSSSVQNTSSNQTNSSRGIGSGRHSSGHHEDAAAANGAPSHYHSTHLMPNVSSTKFGGYSSFRSPDNRKPTLPLPINSKSQTSSPASATGPGLPSTAHGHNTAPNTTTTTTTATTTTSNSNSNSASNLHPNSHPNGTLSSSNMNYNPQNNNPNMFFSMQQSPQNSNFMSFPMSAYNQQFQQQFPNTAAQQQQQQQHAPQAQPHRQMYPPGGLLNTSMPMQANPLQQQQQQQQQPESAVRFRTPAASQFASQPQFANNGGGEQTPISALPSRYVNDMFPFPSPSTFLGPQDWPTGATPTTSSVPQFFMNMMPLPSAGGSNPLAHPQQPQPHPPAQSTPQIQMTAQFGSASGTPTYKTHVSPMIYQGPASKISEEEDNSNDAEKDERSGDGATQSTSVTLPGETKAGKAAAATASREA
ncbi:uncharacterized protein LODBEIA_P51890 [Lodderomyces beijingensis]|uniref:MADS-box domain-containing protein n=1 Tax=Lodderomyces beijingensis TaxID=1775926 RepID=A0ABP0ZW92_9ASCO